MLRSVEFLTFLLSAVVSALPWDGPQPTTSRKPDLALHGKSPAPTAGRGLFELLRKRQSAATCGFVGGDFDNALTCSFGYICSTDSIGYGCCESGVDCSPNTSCVPYSEAESCNVDCQGNSRVTICDYISEPYCGSNLMIMDVGTLTNVGCYESSFTSWIYPTATDCFGASCSALHSSEPFTSSFDLSSDTSFSESTIPTQTSSTAEPISTTASTTSSSPPTTTTASSSSNSKPNAGAIAGGVVGGLAVVAIAALGGIFLFLRQRRSPQNNGPQMAQQQSTYQIPPGGGGGGNKIIYPQASESQVSQPCSPPMSPSPQYPSGVSGNQPQYPSGVLSQTHQYPGGIAPRPYEVPGSVPGAPMQQPQGYQ